MVLNTIRWNVDPEIIDLFGFSLRYYGLLFVGGVFLAFAFLKWIWKREELPLEDLDRLLTYSVVGIMAGARIGHCLFYQPDYYLANPLEIFLPVTFLPEGGFEFTGFQGLASHGGVMGFLIALYLFSRKTGHKMIAVLDYIIVVAGVLFAFIRFGNFMNSEIIGLPTEGPWGIIFERVDVLPRHASQLYEAFAYLSVALIMYLLYRKKDFPQGFLFGMGMTLFFIARFFVEYSKENQVAFEDSLALNMGQLLSLPFIAVGLGLMWYSRRRAA